MGQVSNRFGSRTKSDMRVLYVSSVNFKGSGGHYHSLNHISQAMAEHIEVGICTIGENESFILSQNPFFVQHFKLKNFQFLTFNKKFRLLLNDFKPDIIHFFDLKSYLIVDLLVYPNVKKVLNKCGGSNPKGYPRITNLILFSEENYNWFKSQSKFRNSNIKVIPNRVNPKVLNYNFISDVKKENSFCFVRIARISKDYVKSIEDSIRLISELTDLNFNVHLYLIGAVHDKNIYETLNIKIKSKPITLLTDDKFTRKASDMLYLADAVIATGRGVMEATSLGLPILTPAHNSNFPILIDRDNFNTFFKTNFSQRNEASQNDLNENLLKIKEMIANPSYRKELSLNSNNFFADYFSTEKGVLKYIDYYNSLDVGGNKQRYLSDFDDKIKVFIKMLLRSRH